MAKECFVCKTSKPLDEFYKHKMMADGHLNKCKECVRAYTNARRRDLPDHVRAIDAKRGQNPERKQKKLEYMRNHRKREPLKYLARRMVQQAVKHGLLTPVDCERCGNPQTEAHHPDYSQPLVVVWLCLRCHRLEHQALVG